MNSEFYEKISNRLQDEALPMALVDLEAFDRNVKKAVDTVKGLRPDLKIRIATKSIRVPALIRRVLKSDAIFQGLMTYSAKETELLSRLGFDDFLIAYPTLQNTDFELLKKIHRSQKKVTLMVDCEAHVQALDSFFNGIERPFSVSIDLDLSLRLLGGLVHLGVRRSPVRSAEDVLRLALKIGASKNLKFAGVMGYEAQVAGLSDQSPFSRLINPAIKMIRSISARLSATRRAEVAELLKRNSISYEILNGGGTGSLNITAQEASVTEVTLGSGFYNPHMFDHFSNIRFEPSACFALRLMRSSDPGWMTAFGGGFIASGEPGWSKVPIPAWPTGLKLNPNEGCGEVQTPLHGFENQDHLGKPVFFRHAKAGELMEHFTDVRLCENSETVSLEKTYRGLDLSL